MYIFTPVLTKKAIMTAVNLTTKKGASRHSYPAIFKVTTKERRENGTDYISSMFYATKADAKKQVDHYLKMNECDFKVKNLKGDHYHGSGFNKDKVWTSVQLTSNFLF